MRRLILCALLLSCAPAPLQRVPCADGARRCSAVSTPLLCVAGRWQPDDSPGATACPSQE